MRPRLLELLRCPQCHGRLEVTPFSQSHDQDVVEGVLTCSCGTTFPIVDTIPRMVANAYDLFPGFALRHGAAPSAGAMNPGRGSTLPVELARTQRSFGYQWTTFSEMACDFRENFWNYLLPATPEFLNGRLGLDAGCGFGRHIYHAATCGAEMIGMDFSRAIDASYQNTKHLPNVHLVQGDIYAPPFEPGTFDFVYSIGVLHHLPDPGRGVTSLSKLLRPNGTMFVWLYSKTRRFTNFCLEAVRTVTTHLPHRVVKWLSLVGALVDRYLFVVPYQGLRRIPMIGPWLDRTMLPRVRLYSQYPFQVLHADWFDRLAAPIRFYYSGPEVEQLLWDAALSDVSVAPTGLYGWRGCGVRKEGGAR